LSDIGINDGTIGARTKERLQKFFI